MTAREHLRHSILLAVYTLDNRGEDITVAKVVAFVKKSWITVERYLQEFVRYGWVTKDGRNYILTEAGVNKAEEIASVWERIQKENKRKRFYNSATGSSF